MIKDKRESLLTINCSARYVSSVKRMNEQILDCVKKIRHQDPDAMIILQADHGPFDSTVFPSGTPQDYFYYRHGIFSTVYLPEYESERFKKISSFFKGPTRWSIHLGLFFPILDESVPASVNPFEIGGRLNAS